MRLALYDEEHGYYAKNVKTVGRAGDFSTSATMHGALGEAIVAWVEEPVLIEVGGGDGSLAESILSSMGWWRRRKILYHLVETSEPLIVQQKQRLARFGSRVCWWKEIRGALAACGGTADVFSNELVDAFPAAVLRWDGERGAWDEVFVRKDGGEEFVRSEFDCEWEPADGQRIERHRSYRDWLAGWVPDWKCGRLLTVDYGGTFPDLYWRRPCGSLRAYFAQSRLEGMGEFFQRAGRQDLTADVNFSDLTEWGQSLGLEEGKLSSQCEVFVGDAPRIEEKGGQGSGTTVSAGR